MKITTVSYQKTYPTGQYANEKIWIEATIDEREDVQLVVSNLKHCCDEIHKKNNPHLYQEQETINATPEHYNELIDILTQPQPTKEQQFQTAITQVTDINELEKVWKKIAHNPKYPSLKETYNQKLKELTK